MRVVEADVPASCAIMNEERNVNGTEVGSSSKRSTELSNSPTSEAGESYSASGGRLKFFKDGKFILELSHRREGEKESWMSVPKKSFWPPAPISGVANSTASFSASDDTSSVQLSPWQRDHCWKQTLPRRLRGSQLTFYMTPFSSAVHARYTHRSVLRRLRRRPFESFSPSSSVNGWTRPPTRVKVKASTTRLHNVVQRLWDLVKTSPSSVFSPRKRILREMERVTLAVEEPVKRQRPPRPPAAGNSKGVSSYSITSLLGTREEDGPSFLRTLLHSPSPKSRQQSPLPEPYGPVHPPYMYYPFQSVMPHPPYYVAGSPTHALWTPYPLSSLPRGAGGPYSALVPPYPSPHPPYSWPTSPDCEQKREDTSSPDVPLNLSKHGGG